jgi:pimeloyl-ACP methyl ester carboxylesterase
VLAVWLRAIAILTCLLTGASCASPAERFASRASKRGFAADVVVGTRFSHLVLRRIGPGDDLLHVYLDGDGTPMRAGVPASDPTPRDPLVLDLMALDGAPSVYIGRPCYHGIRDPDCRAELWTSARYSETVVESLVAAVRRVISATGVRRVAWIGHSGGGALARLAAPRLSETVALVTVGANLALQSWATMRRLPPLHGSLDPAAAPPLPAHVYQRHYVGSRDRVVPPEVVRLGAPPAAVVIVTGYGHVCCWTERWPAVLADLATGLAQMSRR